MKFWTYTLNTGSVTIEANDSAMFVSVQCDAVSGSCSILGGIPFKGVSPNSVTLSAGQGVNISALSPASTLDGLTITWIAGNVDLLIGF
jgi:hypothetical protein